MFQLSIYCLSVTNSAFTACSAEMDLGPSKMFLCQWAWVESTGEQGKRRAFFLVWSASPGGRPHCTWLSYARLLLSVQCLHCPAPEVHGRLQLAALGASPAPPVQLYRRGPWWVRFLESSAVITAQQPLYHSALLSKMRPGSQSWGFSLEGFILSPRAVAAPFISYSYSL